MPAERSVSYRQNMSVSAQPVPSGAIPRDAPVLYDTDFAPAASLIADPTRAAILRSLLPGRRWRRGRPGRCGTARRHAPLGLLEERLSRRADDYDGTESRFEVTGAGAATLGSFGLDVGAIRRSRRRFAGPLPSASACLLADLSTFGRGRTMAGRQAWKAVHHAGHRGTRKRADDRRRRGRGVRASASHPRPRRAGQDGDQPCRCRQRSSRS
jgi:hypothetical protein